MQQQQKPDEKVDTLLSRGMIPIIDLAYCGSEGCIVKSVINRVATQLHKALSEKGVAFLVNHGIPEEKLKTAWEHLDDFCELSTETKELYIRKGDDNHGYIKPGLEKFDGKTVELRHAFNICHLKAPEEPLPGFRDHIADLANDFKNVSTSLLRALAISLNVRQDFFLEKHLEILTDNNQNESTLRLLYYPPIVQDDNKCEMAKGKCKYSYQRCTSRQLELDLPSTPPTAEITDVQRNFGETQEKINERGIRCNAHFDYGTFTLLAQDSEGGLEAKLPGCGKFYRVGHLPGAILINTGEILSIMTESAYPALVHRVVVPEQATIRSRGRHSIAFFCHPDNETEVAPIDEAEKLTSEVETTGKKKTRSKSFKTAKTKVVNAYQLIQRRFRETYTT